jgi:hypothetical protein
MQIGKGLWMYAHGWGRYFPANRPDPDETLRDKSRGYDDLSILYTGGFVRELWAFNCPGTRDHAQSADELRFKRSEAVPNDAPAWVPRAQQLSYEYYGEMNPSLLYARTNTRLAWLAHDEDGLDEDSNWVPVVGDRYNHGTKHCKRWSGDVTRGTMRGGNMLFLDVRVEWIPAEEWRKAVTDGIVEWRRVTALEP